MDEAESGLEEREVLRQVSDAILMEEPLPDVLTDALPVEAEPVVPVRPRPRLTWWERHRHELAGLVTAIVSLTWISLGLAARAWAPSLIGVAFALGALLIGSQAVWTGD
jgi:hypothetical protein